jgi:hypothetical protein
VLAKAGDQIKVSFALCVSAYMRQMLADPMADGRNVTAPWWITVHAGRELFEIKILCSGRAMSRLLHRHHADFVDNLLAIAREVGLTFLAFDREEEPGAWYQFYPVERVVDWRSFEDPFFEKGPNNEYYGYDVDAFYAAFGDD